jgi:hypothetical protein
MARRACLVASLAREVPAQAQAPRERKTSHQRRTLRPVGGVREVHDVEYGRHGPQTVDPVAACGIATREGGALGDAHVHSLKTASACTRHEWSHVSHDATRHNAAFINHIFKLAISGSSPACAST